MKLKIACLSALAFLASTAAPNAASATAARTTLTIQYVSSGGFKGMVKARTNPSCVKYRVVKVYNSTRARPFYTDTSDSLGNWSTGNSGRVNGYFYAKTAATSNCSAATSPKIHT